jgi:hypothetical protein
MVDGAVIVDDRQAVPLSSMPRKLGMTIDLDRLNLILDGAIALTVPRLGIGITNDSSPIIVANGDGGDSLRGCYDNVLVSQSIDAFCPCAGAANHGDYVSCVARLTTEWVKRDAITQATRTALVTGAAQSACGKK